jgi:P pilus assembly chaperone PapD
MLMTHFRAAVLLLLLLAPKVGLPLGVDQLSITIDGGAKAFTKKGKFIVFNDDGKAPTFVTAQVFTWDMTATNPLILTPSEDLDVVPPVIRLATGASLGFTVAYRGKPPGAEKTYRVLFRSVKEPEQAPSADSVSTESPSAGANIGLSFTVPVYVFDSSIKPMVLSKVAAKVPRSEGGKAVDIENQGNRHVTVSGYRTDGVDHHLKKGVVLAGQSNRFLLPGAENAKSTEVQISFGDESIWIPAEKSE